MDRHELAMKTYNDLQKRKKRKELQHKMDLECTGWNGYTKHRDKMLKKYYNNKHTIF